MNSIEQYVRQVGEYLHGADFQAIEDTREEIRQHLNARCEELIRDGFSADEALQMAIRKFGSPDKVGRSLARELFSHSYQVKIVCALTICYMLKFAFLFLGPVFSGFEPAFLGHLRTPYVIGMSLMLLTEVISVMLILRSNSSARMRQHTLWMRRQLRAFKPTRAYQSTFGRMAYLVFLLFGAAMLIQGHIYWLAIPCLLEAIEFVFIRTMVKRIAENLSV